MAKSSMCMVCGTPMKASRENVPYDEAGLPGVTLVGVEVHRCPKCGEHEVAIPAIEQLHESLAMELIAEPGRLRGAEIRFLRKYLGLSGAEFARRIGVDPATVSRWENDKDKMGGQADRLLRLMVVHGKPVEEYPLEKLDEVSDEAKRPKRYELRSEHGAWVAAAA